SHPELLDWLAREFVKPEVTTLPSYMVRSGMSDDPKDVTHVTDVTRPWSLKHLHRLIVTSATYRQASAPRPDGLTRDASARLLWRYPPRRLEAEPIRDAILAVSGRLD